MSLRHWLTVLILLTPSAILFKLGGIAYATPFILLVLMFVSLNNLNTPLKKDYIKIVTALPILALFFLLLTNKQAVSPEQQKLLPSELDIVIIISCITTFTAIASSLLILKRTKGKKAILSQNVFYKVSGFIIALVLCATYITTDAISIFVITITGLVLGTLLLLSHKEYLR